MKEATLIKTPDNLILVNDGDLNKLNKNDPYYDGKGNIRLWGTGNCYDTNSKNLLAQSSQIKLSKELSEKIGWVDANKLAKEYGEKNKPFELENESAFKDGFQASQSLNNKYSEEDMIEFSWWLVKNIGQYSDDKTAHFNKEYFNKWEQLQKPKHYQVKYTEDNGIFNVK